MVLRKQFRNIHFRLNVPLVAFMILCGQDTLYEPSRQAIGSVDENSLVPSHNDTPLPGESALLEMRVIRTQTFVPSPCHFAEPLGLAHTNLTEEAPSNGFWETYQHLN